MLDYDDLPHGFLSMLGVLGAAEGPYDGSRDRDRATRRDGPPPGAPFQMAVPNPT